MMRAILKAFCLSLTLLAGGATAAQEPSNEFGVLVEAIKVAVEEKNTEAFGALFHEGAKYSFYDQAKVKAGDFKAETVSGGSAIAAHMFERSLGHKPDASLTFEIVDFDAGYLYCRIIGDKENRAEISLFDGERYLILGKQDSSGRWRIAAVMER